MNERVHRIDLHNSTDLAKPVETPEGYLRVEGRISRCGIQTYHDAAGNEHKELRPPEEVFHPESIASFRLVPVTNTHPDALLTNTTAKAHAVGAVGENLRADGEWLTAPFAIHDRDAISAARSGRSQLSCGYECELDPTPGVWNGEKYDAVQRNIRGNHLALVDIARAGPEARIRLDAARSDVLVCGSTNVSPENTTETTHMPQVIRIDGTSLELNDSNAPAIQQLVDRTIAAAKKDGAEALSTARADKAAAEKKLSTVLSNVSAFKKRADAMKAKMIGCDSCKGTGKMAGDEGAEENCDYCDGKGVFRMHEAVAEHGVESSDDAEPEMLDEDELAVEQETENEAKAAHADKARADAHIAWQRARKKKIDAMADRRADARARLLDVATRALGPDFKLDGKNVLDVKRAIVNKIEPAAKADKLDGLILEGEFRAAVRKLDAAPTASDLARAGTAGAALPQSARADAVTSARQKMLQQNQDAWKRPAPAAK